MAVTPTNERTPLLGHDSAQGKRKLGPHDISPYTRRMILAGIWMATFLGSLNLSLVPTMLPSISSEFKASNQASWLGTAYLLATCTFTPLYGRLSSILGRKGANQVAIVFACMGTIACGLSSNMKMLIAARFLTGIGGGALFTTSTIVVSDMYTLRTRGIAQGFASFFNGLGLGLGGPVGGLITDWFGWRMAFLFQVPLFIIAFLLTTLHLNYETPGKGRSTKEMLKRIDYGGSLTLLIAVGSCLMFLSSKYNSSLSWSDPRVIVPLILTAFFFAVFVLVELYCAKEPVLAPFLLKQKIPVLVAISNFLVATCNFSVLYFFPMWFQTVELKSASVAGLHIAPNSVSNSVGSLFAGWMIHRTGSYKTLNLTFGILPFLAGLLLCFMREGAGPIQSWLSIIPLGFGNAVVMQTTLIALLAYLPEKHMPVGTGFGQLFRGLGQVGGVAFSSALFQYTLDNELRTRLMGQPNAEQLITQIRQAARLIEKLPPQLQRVAKDSYAVSLRRVFLMAAVATLLAWIARLPLPDRDLDTVRPNKKDQPPDDGDESRVRNGTIVHPSGESTPTNDVSRAV